MEIGLQGGVSRVFKPGQHFYSADVLPAGATFNASPARPLEPPGPGRTRWSRSLCAAKAHAMATMKNVHGNTVDHIGEAIVAGVMPPACPCRPSPCFAKNWA
jgi:hypothetical protein